MIQRVFILLLVVSMAVSCKKPDEEPQFKHVRNVQVQKITGDEVLLSAEAVFYNPNDMKMKLRGVDVDVFVLDKKVGKIDQDLKTVIPALDDFVVPFNASFNIKEVGVMNTLMSIMGGKKLQVRYDGNIKVTVHGFPFKVPVDYTDEVRFR